MDQENRQGLDQPGLFYGWFMVAAGFFIMCFAMGTILNCYSLFVKPICEDLGYARQQIALNASLHSCGQMTVALFSGKIFKRFKPRTVMIAIRLPPTCPCFISPPSWWGFPWAV